MQDMWLSAARADPRPARPFAAAAGPRATQPFAPLAAEAASLPAPAALGSQDVGRIQTIFDTLSRSRTASAAAAPLAALTALISALQEDDAEGADTAGAARNGDGDATGRDLAALTQSLTGGRDGRRLQTSA